MSRLKKLLYAICILFISGCMAKYPLLSIKELNDMTENELKQKYIVFLENVSSSKDSLISTTLSFISNDEINQAKKFIAPMLPSDDKTILFSEGIVYFFDEKYQDSLNKLNQGQSEKYEYLRHLLIACCMIELNKSNIYNPYGNDLIMNEFQKSIDLSFSVKMKNIIKMHVKFYKYGE